MALSAQQRAALFEKIKSKMNPSVPKVPTPHPKMIAPIAPPSLPGTPNIPKPNQVNPNFVGEGKKQRFQKLKSMFGL